LVVWGISSRESASTVESFRDYFGLTFPILLDESGAVMNDYSQTAAFPTAAFPQDWVIGAGGEVAYVSNGDEPDELRAVVEEELR
jgi:peroxiredoxin